MRASCLSRPEFLTVSHNARCRCSKPANGFFAHVISAIHAECSNTGPATRTNSSCDNELISEIVHFFISDEETDALELGGVNEALIRQLQGGNWRERQK